MKKIISCIILNILFFLNACLFFNTASYENKTATENKPKSEAYLYYENITKIAKTIPYRITFYDEADAEKPDNPLLAILWEYHPEGYYIIKRMQDLPIRKSNGEVKYSSYMMLGKIPVPVNFPDWEKYIGEGDIIQQLDGMDTAIHEINHSYTHSYFYRIVQDYITFKDKELQYVRYTKKGTVASFYINRQLTILVECDFTNIFPAAELRYVIPEELRTFRFDTYIYPGVNREAEKPDYFNTGIYSFLDEFNAYYQDCFFSYNMYPFFSDVLAQTKDTWLGYLRNLMGSYSAYAEFKYYILTYLLYAQELNSAIYDDIMSNEPFRVAFTMIDDNFGRLIDMIDRRCENLVIFLNQKGFKAEIKDDVFYIDNYGIGLVREDDNILIEEMEKPRYREMLSKLRFEY